MIIACSDVLFQFSLSLFFHCSILTENIIRPFQWKPKCVSLKSSKNAIKKQKYDEKKRTGRAIHSITGNEKNTYENLFSESPTAVLWVYHFGCGDQIDEEGLCTYLDSVGDYKLNLLPGIGYGLIFFNSSEDSKKLIPKGNKSFLPVNFPNGERNVVFIFSLLTESTQVKYSQYKPFPDATTNINIPGLDYINDLISEEEEKILVDALNKLPWNKLSNRQVQHYGYEFIYGKNTINKDNKTGEIPELFSKLMDRFACILKQFKLENNDKQKNMFIYDPANELDTASFFELYGNFDQLTVNDYQPGAGIPAHYDSHSPFEDVFCSVSLCSGITMQFDNLKTEESTSLYLLPRSAIFFSREPRYMFNHSIPTRKLDKLNGKLVGRKRRISLTFRKIRPSECQCDYPEYCDSRTKALATVMPVIDVSSTKPTDVEKIHVYDVYNKIAPHFSHTRYKPWPKVKEYVESLPAHSLCADVGCGNGKYMWLREKDCFVVGTDRSENLLKIVRDKIAESQVFAADSLALPFRTNRLDSVISIAVIHHFSNIELRLKALREINRVLRVGGTALVYVWAKEQEGRNFANQDNYVEWNLNNKYEDDKVLDTLGPENRKEDFKQATVYHRYYHVFIKGELEELVLQAGGFEIIDSYYHKDNWAVVAKKV